MRMRMCEVIDFFEMVSQILDDNDVETDGEFPEKYTQALNTLRYERRKSDGVRVKSIKKVRGPGKIIRCGNCGSESIDTEPQYKFCPNCGYKIIRSWEDR